MPSTGVFNSIRGFNRTWTAITSVKWGPKQEIIGYRFECGCGTIKKFLDLYFHDAHGAAVNALNRHRCVSE
jgi:hypothetical protein